MLNYPSRTLKRGISLVELSIVLVIIGLLVSGVTYGIRLIEQARLNGVISDFQRYKVAFSSYQEIYGAYAGDDDRAEARWGATTCGVAANDCDGNGDDRVSYKVETGTATAEGVSAWRHLELGGFLNGFKIKQPSATAKPSVGPGGNNIPESKVGRHVGYFFADNAPRNPIAGTAATDSTLFNAKMAIYIGKFPGGLSTSSTTGTLQTSPMEGALRPDQAEYLSRKVAFGNPLDGQLRATGSLAETTNYKCLASSTGDTFKGCDDEGLHCIVGYRVVDLA